jgi:phosphopantetheinyl transferase (holo-ACP synthase)
MLAISDVLYYRHRHAKQDSQVTPASLAVQFSMKEAFARSLVAGKL